MRTLPSDMQTLLASGEQIEPVMILGILWDDAGNEILYSDRDIGNPSDSTNALVSGRILEVSQVEESKRSDSLGSSGSVSVVLDDRDGALKAIFDTKDIHKRKVNVYQSFMDLGDPVGDKVKILSGQISTPIVWDEGGRTLSFAVVTKLEDFEVGFSPEMGNYTDCAVELLGKPWPLVFGTVHHSPCLRLQNIPTAFTTKAFGIVDKSIASEITQLQNLLTEAIAATEFFSLQASDGLGFADANTAIQNDPNVQKYTQMQATIQDEINTLQTAQGWQGPFNLGEVGLIPTVYVNQPYNGLLKCGNNLFNGNIKGTGGNMLTTPQILPGAPAAVDPTLRQGFQFFNAGSQVVICDNYPIKYVASITPGTIYKVWAMRTFNGLRQLAVVPEAYYNTGSDDLGHGMIATYVILKQPLSTVAMIQNMKTQIWENAFGKSLPTHIINQIDWEDELYVSFQSDVGPNPVDIMEWIISNFSQNGYDSASFAAVKTKVAGFPMNFTISSMPTVINLIGEIAYQARCLAYLRNDTFYLLYLPEQQTPTTTLTEADVMVDSLKVTTTNTEDLITKYSASYRPDYSPFFDEPVKIVLRYNIPTYGVHEESVDYYTYNSFDAVQSAATYWLTQRSQTWKIFQARLLLQRLDIEVFDYVALNFVAPYVATTTVTGLVTKLVYDSAQKYIDIEIWCPVLAGTTKVDSFGFPASATEKVEWPQFHTLAGGGGGGVSSPQLPAANPRSEPAGILDVLQFTDPTLTNPIDWGQYQSGGSFVPPVPESIPGTKSFPDTPLPEEDPTQDYTFDTPPDFGLTGGTFPGIVQERVGENPDHPDMVEYKVQVYMKGLSSDFTILRVSQMQIDKDDTIPPNTWVEVTIVAGIDDSGNPYFDKTMQVPIWLE